MTRRTYTASTLGWGGEQPLASAGGSRSSCLCLSFPFGPLRLHAISPVRAPPPPAWALVAGGWAVGRGCVRACAVRAVRVRRESRCNSRLPVWFACFTQLSPGSQAAETQRLPLAFAQPLCLPLLPCDAKSGPPPAEVAEPAAMGHWTSVVLCDHHARLGKQFKPLSVLLSSKPGKCPAHSCTQKKVSREGLRMRGQQEDQEEKKGPF